MFAFEKTFDAFWATLGAAQIGTKRCLQLALALRSNFAGYSGLGCIVQQLVRIQLRAVRWKKEQLDVFAVRLYPFRYLGATMYPVPVHNQKYFPAGIMANEPAKKLNKHTGYEFT